MILKRFFDPRLAQSSYLLGCSSTREALIVDPNRDIDRYLEAAAQDGLRVAHVTETHIHADFVSGARELAQRANARLYLSAGGGPDWQYRYATEARATAMNDGDSITVGRIEVRALHLPGHTPEHLVFLITDTEVAGEPMGALTGDFLFVGDVGRPDLLERAVGSRGTMETSARQLYHSLQKFRAFSDYLQIWPGHGAGSACGKSLSAVPQSTLGYEKRFNWAFGVQNEDDFVRAVLAGQPDPPRYFAQMKRINLEGPPLLGQLPLPTRLTEGSLMSVLQSGSTVVDTRDPDEYGRGAIPGTINIPNSRAFPTWAGSLLPYDRELYLIVPEPGDRTVEELVRSLAGIGMDRVAGYFGSEVVGHWRKSRGELQTIPVVTLEQLSTPPRNGVVVLDVRGVGEWEAGHIPGSVNLPIAELEARLNEIPRGRPLIVHCQTGARAAIAVSLLRAGGFDDVRLFRGGFAGWRAAGQPVGLSQS
ncbi:MAG: rhodanese-like domain-containing protein [Gemmatimonadales bacterium]